MRDGPCAGNSLQDSYVKKVAAQGRSVAVALSALQAFSSFPIEKMTVVTSEG